MARRVVRLRGIAALVIGYPLLAHYINKSAHGGNLGAIVAIAEYWVRRWVLPTMPHTHILDAVLAFRNTSALPHKLLQP
jgi:hypothetical protein